MPCSMLPARRGFAGRLPESGRRRGARSKRDVDEFWLVGFLVHCYILFQLFLSRGDDAVKKFLLTLAASVAACAIWPVAAHAEARELVVASSATYTPFACENKDKQIAGFAIDIMDAIATQEHMNLRIVN